MSIEWASLTQPITKTMRAGSNLLIQLDVGALIVPAWQADMAVSAGMLVRPTRPNQTGFWYQAGGAGQTGADEPGWAAVAGSATDDGSVIWSAVSPPGSGQDSVASSTWSQVSPPDSTLTIGPSVNTQRVAQAYVGGGTSGSVYTIDVAITMASTAIYIPQIILTVL